MGKILGKNFMVYDGKFFCRYDISAELGGKSHTLNSFICPHNMQL